ncbi:MAG: endopeptidase La [Anaerolineae bacterium]|nr:endopeptidase La [Anaerolineae bacterium]
MIGGCPLLERDEELYGVQVEEVEELPVLPLRDTVVFPHMVAPLMVGRDRSVRALESAVRNESDLVVVTQRHAEVADPGRGDLYEVGTVVSVARTLRMPDGTTSVLAQGQGRVRIVDVLDDGPFLRARVVRITESRASGLPVEALMRAVLTLFERCVHLSDNMPEDAYVAAMNIDDPGWLADMIASILTTELGQRQDLLETLDPVARLQKISMLLAKELDVLELEDRIQSRVQEEVDRSQREYFLREQMRAIQRELGENDPFEQEMDDLQERLLEAEMPPEARERVERELARLRTMPPGSPESGIIRTYVEWLLDLPWARATEDDMDVTHVADVLDRNHYGLEKVKERIVEHIAVRKLAGETMRTPILCFVGPPGTGKTSIGRSIAEALGRNFVRVSLGGVRDEAEIRGHRRTYIGALPGRIIQTMRRAGSVNPVFMLDEIDKLGYDFRGDPSAALLEVLDPEQNNSFSDHYLEVAYDLSKVMFITTANWLDPVPDALRDRMEVIEFPGYTEDEKVAIARQFLIPKELREHGLARVAFSDGALRQMIREYTYEAGVRNLDRQIANVFRKIARRVAEGKAAPTRISARSLSAYLGVPKFTYGLKEEEDQVGVATGLAVTEVGGDVMTVEVTAMEGKGSLLLTGQLGDVMQESAQAALSYARANAAAFGLEDVDFDKLDLHVHVPEGAVPKDGPSAGITIATAILSALTGRPVRREVGLTGEITLRGRVLAIGGLKEKILAAHRAGLETIVIPRKNERELVEVPRRIRQKIRFVSADSMDDVVTVALAGEQDRQRTRRTGRHRRSASVP